MIYTIAYHVFNKEDSNEARYENRQMLSQFVMGVKCTFAGEFEDTVIPENVVIVLKSRLNPDEKLGTIESYENGYHNIYVRIYKDDGSYYLDGFFKLYLSQQEIL